MRDQKNILLAVLAFVVWVVLAWSMGGWLGLAGAELWILRAGLWLIGLAGLAGFLWLRQRTFGDAGSGSGGSELDTLFREADARLQTPGQGRPAAKIADLPCLILLGEPGSAKTSTVIHSGLDPELLAGHAFQDTGAVPTRLLNLWYADRSVFADVGGSLLPDGGNRKRLLRRLAPARLASVFGGKGQAPRAVLLCVDTESFLKPGAAEATASRARQYNAWLGEIAEHLGIHLPVYVLFTRMDRVPHFQEFVGNLTAEETAQIFGVSLPMAAGVQEGVYAERETGRLTDAFRDLFYSLCDRRPDFLKREHDTAKLPAVYEFPREFRKLRSLMVQFLVDVCRPSQLRTSPFLRGLYFTGVRPVVVSDVMAEAAPRRAAPAAGSRATQVFNAREVAAQTQMLVEGPGGGRRIPQWVFLSHLFSDVILRDRAALSSSGASVKVDFGRRILLAAAVAVALVLAVGWTVSWSRNRSLRNEALDGARALPAAAASRDDLASLESLQPLDRVRQSLATLAAHRQHRPPMSYRWGLYAGDGLYEGLHRLYFDSFRKMLLAPAQASILELLTRPGDAGALGYRPVYDALKGHLIMSSHPQESTLEFLPPVLMDHWLHGREVDAERAALARRQFEFYADALRAANPYPNRATPDANAVADAREYLEQFAATEAIYSAMINRANQQENAFVFNEAYPGSASVVVNRYRVPGAFSKNGWKFMQDAIRRPDEYFAGEAWVLGPQSLAEIDRRSLRDDLQKKYRAEFVGHWRNFLRDTAVVRFAGMSDAATKLSLLSGNQSPLLAALCAVSTHTSVEEESVAGLFQPPQQVEPNGCEASLAAPANDAYVNGLIRLQAALQQLDADNRSEAFRAEAVSSASAAQVAVRQMARSFPVDREGEVDARTQSLLEAPIRYAQGLIAGAPSEAINAGARALCGQIRALAAKFPFNPGSTNQATLAELNGIFQPGSGSMWLFYNQSLSQILIDQGGRYAANPGGGLAVTAAFQDFFNRAAALSRALYPSGGGQPQLAFSLRPGESDAVDETTLTINGRRATLGRRSGAQQFVWPGDGAQGVQLRVKFSGGTEFEIVNETGLWAAFQFFLKFERWQTAGAEHTLEWTASTPAGPMIINGRPAILRFVLNMGGAPPIFQRGYLAGMNCPSTAAR